MKSRAGKQKPRNHRALEEWQTKWRSVYQNYTTPQKLRRKDRSLVMLLRAALLELIEDYPQFLTLTFWDDLKQKGIDSPVLLPLLLRELWRDPSEVLRTIADFVDAWKAPKGDRGARLQATEKLYDYAYQVMGNGAKKLNWRQLKEKFCTYYEDDGNWQKFLRKRGIPFKKVGTFRVVVPTLWGYTEQARRIKKTVTLKRSGERRAWNEEDFTADLQAKLKAPDTKSALAFYDFCRTLPGAVLKWGTGTERGSFSVTFPPAIPRSILSVFSDGELCLNFNWLDQSEVQLRVRDRFLESLTQIPTLDLGGQDPSKGRTIRPERWIPAVDRIKDAVRSALTEIR